MPAASPHRFTRALRRILPASLALSLAACGNYPRDAEDTLASVRSGVLRAGLSHDPPYVVAIAGRAPTGPDVELVQGLAQQHGARVEWVHGGHDALMEQLQHFQLDMVVGGHATDSPWQPHVGWSRHHLARGEAGFTERRLALPPGENAWQMAVDGYLHAQRAAQPQAAR